MQMIQTMLNQDWPSVQYCADQNQICQCSGNAYYGTLDQMFNVKSGHNYKIAKNVGASIKCNSGNF